MKVLVTGGCGFVGSAIARKLLSLGFEITIVDNLTTGKILNAPVGVEIIKADIRSLRIENIERHDYIVHCAAKVGTNACVADPEEAWSVNIYGTAVVCDLARKWAAKTVFLSTAAVYAGERYYYGGSKTAGEVIVSLRPKWSILRLFNVFGDGQNPAYGAVIPEFIAAKKEGRTVKIYGDGKQTRDFIHVDDVAENILMAMQNPASECSDCGTGEGHQIVDVAEMVGVKYEILNDGNGGIKNSIAGTNGHPAHIVKPERDLKSYIKERIK